jgi:hypothetical protein
MSDLSRDYHGPWRFRLPAPSSSLLWKSGMVKKPMCQLRNRLCIIVQVATGLLVAVNILITWKGYKDDKQKHFSRFISSVEVPGSTFLKGSATSS